MRRGGPVGVERQRESNQERISYGECSRVCPVLYNSVVRRHSSIFKVVVKERENMDWPVWEMYSEGLCELKSK